MGKGKAKKKEKIVKYEFENISEERMIEIQAEAYYRAMKRLEKEKMVEDVKDGERKKDKWYIDVLFLLNVLIRPAKIHKRFYINNQIHDSILVMFVSGMLWIIGSAMRLLGVAVLISGFFQVQETGRLDNLLLAFTLGLAIMLIGSMFVIANKEFSKETDSNKIYAYSAGILALISCVISIVSLLKM